MRIIAPVVWLLVLAAPAPAGGEFLPNPSFEEGGKSPAGWTLSGGEGEWAKGGSSGQRSISVTGNGSDSSSWICDDFRFEPRQVYCVSFSMKGEGGGGCAVTGTTSNNLDIRPTSDWKRWSFTFTTQGDTSDVRLRLGQWHFKGTVWFDEVEVTRVVPLNRRVGELALGRGETLAGGRYRFESRLGEVGSNCCRTLVGSDTHFNTHRLVLSAGDSATYRFGLPGTVLESGEVRLNVGWHAAGECVVEAGNDGASWTEIGRIDGLSDEVFAVPEPLLPAGELYVRFRASEGASFQIYAHSFTAAVDGPPAEIEGETRFVEILSTTPRFDVDVRSVGTLLPGAGNEVELVLTAREDVGYVKARVRVNVDGTKPVKGLGFDMEAGTERICVPYAVPDASARSIVITVSEGSWSSKEGGEGFAARVRFTVPSLNADDYGYLLLRGDDWDLWWCEGAYKVSRDRAAPTVWHRAVRMEAARNEYEPVQVVLRPKQSLTNLRATVSDLAGPDGSVLGAENVTVRRVGYVHVTRPTDEVGAQGWWPDPLLPLSEPIDLEAGQNQPLWVTLFVPEDQPPGDYRGTLRLEADGSSAELPLEVHVWDFALPKETHVKTAFGLDHGRIRRYHRIESTDSLRQVLDAYYQNFAEHRISPYDPMALDPMVVDFGDLFEGGQPDGTKPYQGRLSLRVVDDSATATTAASYTRLIPIDPSKPYRVDWAVRTAAAAQDVMITFCNYDRDRQWIRGGNIDLYRTGGNTWKLYSADLTGRFPKDAAFTRPVLRPTSWREDGSTTGTAWFDNVMLTDEVGDGNLIEGGYFEPGTGSTGVTIDWAAFDRAARKYLDGMGFNTFRLRLAGMGGGTFHSRSNGRIGAHERGTVEYDRLFSDYVRQVEEHLAQNGWLDEAYLYWFDEPEPRDYEFVRAGMDTVHRFAPGIQRMLTEQPEEELFGAVDIWCPVLHQHDVKACWDRQNRGEKVWWYVCTGPRGDYTTLFTDHPAVNMRMWLWLTWKYGVEGVLVWTTNHWTSSCAYPHPALQNPYEDPMAYVQGYDRPVGFIGYWGNGDGRFIYPPEACFTEDEGEVEGGPVDSFRWEMLRDGIEDYEYLWLLRQTGAAVDLLHLPDTICASLTDFSRDPMPLYTHRRKVAEAIERNR